MIIERTYKKMSESDVLGLLSKESAADPRSPVFGDMPDKFFSEMVAKKRMFCTEIIFNGEPLYRMFWLFQNEGKNLHICAATQISNRQNVSALCDGAEKIARINKCEKITFCTDRAALVQKAKSWGAVVSGVTMEKIL